MQKDKYDALLDALDTLTELQEEVSEHWKIICDEYWDSLDDETKQKAFCAVVSRIYKGEIVEGGSYRGILYRTFGFDESSYGRAIDCGYLTIHNRLLQHEDEIDRVEHISEEEYKQEYVEVELDGKPTHIKNRRQH